jgi:molybdopterin synthase catalytic subunit
MHIKVQAEDFDVNAALTKLRGARKDIGAIVNFIGLVRDLNEGDKVSALTLEHYPGMTEKALADIAQTAKSRWDILDVMIIHRVGKLEPCEQIVLVAVSSAHRGEAFKACEFIMDYLKTSAPFWKKEQTPTGERWVEAKETDDVARDRWAQKINE